MRLPKRIKTFWTGLTEIMGGLAHRLNHYLRLEQLFSRTVPEPPVVGEKDIFIQELELPVGSLGTARKSVATMISRFSPIPPEDAIWDLSPAGARLEKGVPTGKHSYRLAIMRKSDLATYQGARIGAVQLQTSDEECFEFLNMPAQRQLGNRIAAALLITTLTYGLSIWSLGQWEQRYLKFAGELNDQSAALSLQAEADRAQLDRMVHDQAQLITYQVGASNFETAALYSDLDTILQDGDYLQSLQLSASDGLSQADLIGVAKDPAAILSAAERKLPIFQARLGNVSRYGQGGERRFALELVKREPAAKSNMVNSDTGAQGGTP